MREHGPVQQHNTVRQDDAVLLHGTIRKDGTDLPEIPYSKFDAFIKNGADRLNILLTLLDELDLNCTAVNLAGSSHIFVNSGSRGQAKTRTTLIAHYDRATGSPGANDNSAAVFQLIETALILQKNGVEGWRIIFTDKEELTPGARARDQGSYTLAKTLREAGRGDGQFFIFDACGVGDTLIISTMTDHVMKDEDGLVFARLRRENQALRSRALETARLLMMDKVLLAPIPFSDDLGFLRAGLNAQTITVLPSGEAAKLSVSLHKKGFADTLISRERQRERLIPHIPETWRTLNGPEDTAARLTPENYKLVVRFARALCGG
jgi:hypothetical protein